MAARDVPRGFFAGDLAGQAAKRKSPKAARDVKGSVMAAGGAAGAVHIDAEDGIQCAAFPAPDRCNV